VPKIAIVHDWLTAYAGSERVLEQILFLFPDADLFCVCDFLPESERLMLKDRHITTTFIQRLPLARTHYRNYLPLMPLAVEQLDLSGYDLVISSSHAVAKGVLTGPEQVHISYVHSPLRYAWDLQHQYLRESNLNRGIKGWLAKFFLHYMRQWDVRTANGVDCFIANSIFIAGRIWKVYRRRAKVIYPPVDVEKFTLWEHKEDFYLTASRLVSYKKIDAIVDAFHAMPNRHLIVIGDGPDMDLLRRKKSPNIEILGYQPFEILRVHMQRAKAFVFAAEEDFGIAPVEAQACGTPVIAFGKGGALETDRALGSSTSPTGIFFNQQTPESIQEAINRFERDATAFTPGNCRTNALRFSPNLFREQFLAIVANEKSRRSKRLKRN